MKIGYKDRFAFNSFIPTKMDTARAIAPQRLSEVKIPKESLEEVARRAVADPAMLSNIRKISDPQEIFSALLAAW